MGGMGCQDVLGRPQMGKHEEKPLPLRHALAPRPLGLWEYFPSQEMCYWVWAGLGSEGLLGFY